MLLVDTTGAVIASWEDIRFLGGLPDSVAARIQQPFQQDVPAIANRNLIPDPDRVPTHSITRITPSDNKVTFTPLDESETVLLEAREPVLSPSGDRLYIIDARQYTYDIYATRTGSLVETSDFSRYREYFRKDTVDARYWNAVHDVPGLIKLLGAIPASDPSNEPDLMATMPAGFEEVGFHGTRPAVILRSEYVRIELDDTSFRSVQRLLPSRYVALSPYAMTRDGNVISAGTWVGGYDSVASGTEHYTDSCAVLTLVDHTNNVHPLLFAGKIPPIGAAVGDILPHPPAIVALSSDHAVYVSPAVRRAAIVALDSDGRAASIKGFDSAGNLARICGTDSDEVSILGAGVDSSGATLYFSDFQGGKPVLAIDRYDFGGHLVGQQSIILPDGIHEFHVIPRSKLLLIHFNRLRWQILDLTGVTAW